MEENIDSKQTISRKRFLQICGSIIAGGSILGISSVLVRRMFTQPDSTPVQSAVGSTTVNSPYRLVGGFIVPDQIEAFELFDNKLIAAVPNNLYIYHRDGSLLNTFAIGSNLRDIAVADGCIYLLFPTRIEVYSEDGELLRDWEACSEESDYCSLAVASGTVFVSDAAAKNICKYTTEGGFVKFIQSPNRFIIPSYSFGITHVDGTIYCSNSGRHLVESYTLDGEYIGAFGKGGTSAGTFCGCCNPVHLTHTSTGEIITSEKGIPRISCYSADGKFRNILLDGQALGGGSIAYDVKVQDDYLFVAGRNKISTFRYDKTLAAKSGCTTCGVSNCPLRKGVTI